MSILLITSQKFHLFSLGLPPVPKKLAARIHSWDFVEMADLLPDRMGVSPRFKEDDSEEKGKKPVKKRQVTNILEWVQCFGIYTAVVAEKFPNKVHDLMGYQALILEANMEYEGGTWMGYDRRFRLSVAGQEDAVWARIDPTLWNMAFTGHAKAKRCKYCFSLTHAAQDCDLAPAAPTVTPQATAGPFQGPKQKPQICYSWNHNQEAQCVFPGCKYLHICLYCARDPQASDKQHKAIHCQKHKPKLPTQPLFPSYNSQPTAGRFKPY